MSRARLFCVPLLAALVCGGCASDSEPAQAAECARYATEVVAHEFGPGQDSGQSRFPELVLGPPRGAGCCQGNTADVVSLGNGGTVTVGFGATRVFDGPGPDFIVFENAFQVDGRPEQLFAELATVEVSADGHTWVGYECSATEPPYGRCAGWHPVNGNVDQGNLEPLDPAVVGGDAFDLAELGLSSVSHIRITDRVDLTGLAGVFDLDAVGIVNAACP